MMQLPNFLKPGNVNPVGPANVSSSKPADRRDGRTVTESPAQSPSGSARLGVVRVAVIDRDLDLARARDLDREHVFLLDSLTCAPLLESFSAYLSAVLVEFLPGLDETLVFVFVPPAGRTEVLRVPIGLGLIGAELPLIIEGAAGVRNPWLLSIIPILVAAGGGVGRSAVRVPLGVGDNLDGDPRL